MGSVRRVVLRLAAAAIASMLAILPLSATAASVPSVDSLWNQPQGVAMDSAWYVVQAWWDGFNRQVPDDPTQRGFNELSQANADLLNAYTLLQHEHAGGVQPVALIDPLASTVYDSITGASVKAPLGSLLAGINQGLLNLEGRASTADQVHALLQDYRAHQAAAVRDLHVSDASAYDSLLSSNGQREADFLTQVVQVSTANDGLASLLADAGRQTGALARPQSYGQVLAAASSHGKSGGAAGNGKATGQGGGNSPGSAAGGNGGAKRPRH